MDETSRMPRMLTQVVPPSLAAASIPHCGALRLAAVGNESTPSNSCSNFEPVSAFAVAALAPRPRTNDLTAEARDEGMSEVETRPYNRGSPRPPRWSVAVRACGGRRRLSGEGIPRKPRGGHNTPGSGKYCARLLPRSPAERSRSACGSQSGDRPQAVLKFEPTQPQFSPPQAGSIPCTVGSGLHLYRQCNP